LIGSYSDQEQSSAILRDTVVSSREHLAKNGIAQLMQRACLSEKIVVKLAPRQTRDILHHERPWPRFIDCPHKLRNHVSNVDCAQSLSAHGKGLARGASRHKVNAAESVEIKGTNITRQMLHILEILAVAFDCRIIKFNGGFYLPARPMKPKRKATSTREYINGGAIHYNIFPSPLAFSSMEQIKNVVKWILRDQPTPICA
jgi:hypothetical protein